MLLPLFRLFEVVLNNQSFIAALIGSLVGLLIVLDTNSAVMLFRHFLQAFRVFKIQLAAGPRLL